MFSEATTVCISGVIISHGNLMSGMSGQIQRIAGLGPDDTYIAYLPLAHVLELSAGKTVTYIFTLDLPVQVKLRQFCI